MTLLTALSALVWFAILALPWRPWSTRERLEGNVRDGTRDLSDVTVLIPARDEAGCIARTLTAVARQGEVARIILIDDQSADGTADRARALNLPRLEVLEGQSPPADWSGKLWALHQGFSDVRTSCVLLLDADIELDDGILPTLHEKLTRENRDLVSLMASLPMQTFWEKLLIPPFIYFFKMLYPFALANSPSRLVAAAAGGCILIRTAALHRIGGFAALRGALIDDCTLARRVKDSGGATWLGLSRGARAIRPYGDLAGIWNMVARTAFTQLRYSAVLLALCTGLLIVTFLVPVIGLWADSRLATALAAAACAAMFITYLPVVSYYRRGWWWLPTLPLAATLYLAMTWTSALRYWRGERSRWKNRVYERR